MGSNGRKYSNMLYGGDASRSASKKARALHIIWPITHRISDRSENN